MDGRLKFQIKLAATAVLIGSGIFLGKFIYNNITSKKNLDEVKVIIKPDIDTEENTDFDLSKAQYDELLQKYPNMKAWIAFPDEFISLPIVQGQDNDYYLRHWIDGSFDEQGSIFFSSFSNIENDQNVTIYGHRVSYDETARFTPLLKLVDQDEYNNHNTFKIWTRNTVKTYLITNVFIYDSFKDMNFDFTQSNFTQQEALGYINTINMRNLIHPIDTVTPDDKFVSLQTCRNGFSQEKVIVIAKEISVTPFE